jgi:streptogramin lyase
MKLHHAYACLLASALLNPLLAMAQTPAEYLVDNTWAQLPEGKVWSGNTSWITADGQGNIIVLERSHPYFWMFKRDGSFVKSWDAEIELGSAHSVTIDKRNFYWVTDSVRHVVHKMTPDGKVMMTLGSLDEAGDNASHELFNQPNHVFIADNEDIYISDGYVNSRIVHFSPQGEFIRIIGGEKGTGPGQFQAVHGVVLDSAGRIIINDSENFRVQVFNPDGSFAEIWDYPSRGGIEIRGDDRVFISDVNEGVINVVHDGELLETYSAPRAHGLGVDTDETIFVSGASRNTVMKIVMPE